MFVTSQNTLSASATMTPAPAVGLRRERVNDNVILMYVQVPQNHEARGDEVAEVSSSIEVVSCSLRVRDGVCKVDESDVFIADDVGDNRMSGSVRCSSL